MDEGKKECFYSNKLVVLLVAMLCCALWGSAFPGIKVGYSILEIQQNDYWTQILFAGCRFLLAGIFIIIIASCTQKKIVLPKKKSWKNIIKLSMFQTVLQYVFFYIGLANTSGVKASIIGGTNVFIAIFVAAVIFKQEKLKLRKVIGCCIGFVGVVIINLESGLGENSLPLFGEGMIVLSTVAYAISSVLIKEYSKVENPVVLSGSQFFLGGIIMILLGVLGGGRINNITVQGIVILLYLAGVSAVAYTMWGILLKYNPVSEVTIYGFMNPIFGVILSGIFLREKGIFHRTTVLALAFVCFGIFFSLRENSND